MTSIYILEFFLHCNFNVFLPFFYNNNHLSNFTFIVLLITVENKCKEPEFYSQQPVPIDFAAV